MSARHHQGNPDAGPLVPFPAPAALTPLDVEADMTAGSGPVFVVNRGALVTGVALVSVGGLLLTAGAAITTVALLQATRRWAAQLDTPPSEVAKRQLAHARAATSAGVNAWRSAS